MDTGVAQVGQGGTGGASAATASKRLGQNPDVQQVCTRGALNGVHGNWSGPGLAQRTQHTLPAGAKDISVVYAGFYTRVSASVAYETAVNFTNGVKRAVSAVPVAGGASYAVGDIVVPTVVANQFAPTLVVTEVSAGAVTKLAVAEPGSFAVEPLAALTQASTSGSGTGLTVTLTTESFPYGLRLGIEKVWGTQAAETNIAPTGVRKAYFGAAFGGIGAAASTAQANLFVPAGGLAASDFVPLNAAAGSQIGIRVYTQAGNWWTDHRFNSNESFRYSAFTDLSAGGTFGAQQGSYAFMPMGCLGHVDVPSVNWVIIGDSEETGTIDGANNLDTGDTYGDVGWIERILDVKYPWSNLSTVADQVQWWVTESTSHRRWSWYAMAKPSDVLIGLGVNDVNTAGISYANFKIEYKALTDKARALSPGVRVWCVTLVPLTTSTDSWATTANQTVTAGNTVRQSINGDLRVPATALTTYGCDRVIDVAAVVEQGGSSAPTGKWNAPNYTGDGLHPSITGHIAIETALEPSLTGLTLAQ